MVNSSAAESLVYLCVSTMHGVEIVEYPDSGKVGVGVADPTSPVGSVASASSGPRAARSITGRASLRRVRASSRLALSGGMPGRAGGVAPGSGRIRGGRQEPGVASGAGAERLHRRCARPQPCLGQPRPRRERPGARQPDSPRPRTRSSNPSSSSGESANFQFLARCDCDGETRFVALAYGKFESCSLQRRVYKLSVPGHVGQPTTGRATRAMASRRSHGEKVDG
jgi:hypothetical protein